MMRLTPRPVMMGLSSAVKSGASPRHVFWYIRTQGHRSPYTTIVEDMASDNALVLVLGGTGLTGQSVVNGLLKSGNFVREPLVRVFSCDN